MAGHDVSARLGELHRIPTLVVSAEHDPIALPRFGQRLAKLIPGARFEEVQGASHGVIIGRAEAINRRLREFIEAAEQSSGPAGRQIPA